MTADSEGLSARVRRLLREGMPREAVVQALVARGLSWPTAERIVERTLSEEATSTGSSSGRTPWADAVLDRAAQAAEDEAIADLFKGGLAIGLGLVATVLSIMLAPRGRIASGLIAWGIYRFGRGMLRCGRLTGPLPEGRVVMAMAIPGGSLVLSLILWHGLPMAIKARNDSGRKAPVIASTAPVTAKAEPEAAARSRIEPKPIDPQARREADVQRLQAHVQAAVTRLQSKQPITQCDAALELGRLEARDHVSELTTVLWDEHSYSRNCAAGALVRLGEKQIALEAYAAWAAGTDADLRRSALSGFGEIGPDAAEVGMPFLTDALHSPSSDVRTIASVAISKVRPQAAP